MTTKFKVGDRAWYVHEPDGEGVSAREAVEVTKVGDDGTLVVRSLVDGDHFWTSEGYLEPAPAAACGFCVALDGGTCVDCEGYKHMATERINEDRADDPVNHPSHYNRGKIEVIDFITDQGLNYTRGNAVKYISRAGYKNPDTEIEDLEKARFCIDYEIKRLKAQGKS